MSLTERRNFSTRATIVEEESNASPILRTMSQINKNLSKIARVVLRIVFASTVFFGLYPWENPHLLFVILLRTSQPAWQIDKKLFKLNGKTYLLILIDSIHLSGLKPHYLLLLVQKKFIFILQYCIINKSLISLVVFSSCFVDLKPINSEVVSTSPALNFVYVCT